MLYKVIVAFSDLEDNGHLYHIGDDYPRVGIKPKSERVEFLRTNKNLLGRPVIKAVKEGTKEVAIEAKPVRIVTDKPQGADTGSAVFEESAQGKPKKGLRRKKP